MPQPVVRGSDGKLNQELNRDKIVVYFNDDDLDLNSAQDRKFYQHNPNVTLMRLTKEESAQLGEIFAKKLNNPTAQ